VTYYIPLEFEWNDAKDRINQKKHGLSFAEAQQLFERMDYLEIFDTDHSEIEDRFIAIGPIDRGLVVVVYTEPEDNLIRIIGARSASNREQDLYRLYRTNTNER